MIDEAAARPMQGLNILLFLGLGRHELHVRKHQCGANGFGIVFLMFDEGFDILRRDHLDRMAKRFELPLPIEGPCAGFDTNGTRLQFSNLGQQSFALDAAFQPVRQRLLHATGTRFWPDQFQ